MKEITPEGPGSQVSDEDIKRAQNIERSKTPEAIKLAQQFEKIYVTASNYRPEEDEDWIRQVFVNNVAIDLSLNEDKSMKSAVKVFKENYGGDVACFVIFRNISGSKDEVERVECHSFEEFYGALSPEEKEKGEKFGKRLESYL
ncbi:MAG: hypothetical protein ACYC1K_03185 [Minisyncoccota bacterium]